MPPSAFQSLEKQPFTNTGRESSAAQQNGLPTSNRGRKVGWDLFLSFVETVKSEQADNWLLEGRYRPYQPAQTLICNAIGEQYLKSNRL